MAQPTANEQELLELINRMRLNPGAELALLLDPKDGNVQYGLAYYGIDRALLAAQWSKLKAVPPLAWSSELNVSAYGHNLTTIAHKQQAHVLPGELSVPARIAQAGYQATLFGENVYAASQSVLFTHTGLAIDWGNGANTIGGIQTPALHRENMMSKLITEVGISAIEDHSSAPIGPMVVTEDFGTRAALSGKAWLLGVAFEDTNSNGWYNAGEGLSDINVKITGINGTHYSDTIAVGQAGGYQELLDPGQYQVDFSENGRQLASQIATIDAHQPSNVKVDLHLTVAKLSNNPPSKIAQNSAPIAQTTTLVLPVLNLGSNLQAVSTEGKVLDFRTDATSHDLTTKTIALQVVDVTADAQYHNYAGFYRVEDLAGTVLDPTNGKSYQPSDSGYVSAALRRAQVVNNGIQLDKNGLAGDAYLHGGDIYAPFVVANGRVNDVLNSQDPAVAPKVYFSYQAANADGIEHVRMLGTNKFGFEDMHGGGDRDFNDLVFQVNASVQN
jgi:Domain of unknown function (DUF4114)/SdrD B-like domain/Cysteine-rich secretory protein family